MSQKPKLKVAYCGTPDIGLPCLDFLSKHPDIEVVAVISQPDRPAGRGQKMLRPAIAQFAQEKNLCLFQTEDINKDLKLLKFLNEANIDLILVFAFAQFLSEKVLSMPKLGCLNLHTSLLPKYRGAAPIQYALLNGDRVTGVSIQKMVKKMDAGPIAHAIEVPIADDETSQSLYEKLKDVSVIALKELFEKIFSGRLEFSDQDESMVSYAPTIDKSLGHIDFAHSTVEQAINKLKAFTPWPGMYCFLDHRRLRVHQVKKIENFTVPAGTIRAEKGGLFVGLKNGTIEILEAQWEGKASCSGVDIINGFKGQWRLTPQI